MLRCQHEHAGHCPGRRHQQYGADGHWRSRYQLFTEPASSPKGAKSASVGVYNLILYLSPGDSSGTELCHWRTPGCSAACLGVTTDKVRTFPAVKAARVRRSHAFVEDASAFTGVLAEDIAKAQTDAAAKGMQLGVRLNGTSDIPWEAKGVDWQGQHHRNLMDAFPGVQFYDYTKSLTRAMRSNGAAPGGDWWPRNYHLTFSYSDSPTALASAEKVLAAGGNVSVVFKHGPLPTTWHGYPVIDATKHDARFKDSKGSIAGLILLGNVKDTYGFAVDPENTPQDAEKDAVEPDEDDDEDGQERRRHGTLTFMRPRSRDDRRRGR